MSLLSFHLLRSELRYFLADFVLQAETRVLPMLIGLFFGLEINDVVGFLLVLIDSVLHLALLGGLHQGVRPIAEGISLVLDILSRNRTQFLKR